MYLWWPKSLTWLQVRNVVWFRGGLRAKARDFNWHNAIGFWSALPLAIVVYSGVVISYPWASKMVYRVVGEAPPAPVVGRGVPGGPGPERAAAVTTQAAPVVVPPAMSAPSLDLDTVIARTMRQAPGWAIITARIPTATGAPVSFTIDRGDGGQPQARSTVAVNAASGAIEQVDDFGSQTPGRRLRSILRFAHTGDVLGLPGQTVAGLVSAGGSVLVYTGLALSARRLAAWWRRRSGHRADRSIAA